VITNSDKKHNELFAIVENDGRSFVPISDVVRLIAEGANTWVIFDNGEKVFTSKNLGYYVKVLPIPDNSINNKFYRVHHKHLINLSYMKKYSMKEKKIYLYPEGDIPISQRRAKGFKEMLKSFGLY